MHEALLRAARQGTAHAESVARFQSERVTRLVYDRSALPLPKPPAPAGPRGSASPGRTLLWPYPGGSAHIIERAHCAELFLRTYPRFRVITDDDLDGGAAAATDPARNVLLFCAFDTVLPRLSVTPDNRLAVDGRPVDAVASEMILGFLMRAGLWPKPTRGANFTHVPAIGRLRTRLVNGTGLALFKAAQMAHFQRHRHDVPDLDTMLPQGHVGWDRAEVHAVSEEWLARGDTVVYRPFASSRGTAVSFLGPHDRRPRRRAIDDVLDTMEAAMGDRYGHADPYPITLSTFVESRKIDGRVCELRVFVVADPSATVHAIPGMVCLTRVPLGEPTEPETSTSLNSVVVSGHRELPLSDPDVLSALGLDVKHLELLGRFAALLWTRAVAAERAATGLALPFAYGSVDFLLTEDGRVTPFEMNGANVSAHSAVHPLFLDAFAIAMRAALEAALP